MRIKICGNVFAEDAQLVAEQHPDLMGWILSPVSPRRVTLEQSRIGIELARRLSPQTLHVAVLANNSAAEIAEALSRLGTDFDLIQWTDPPDNPSVPAGRLVPALRVRGPVRPEDLGRHGRVPFFVFDSFVPGKPGGTGERLDPQMLEDVRSPYLLAGGLKPDNLLAAWQSTPGAFGVDVSSGLELSPGRKDPQLLKEFFARARVAPEHPAAALPLEWPLPGNGAR